MLQELILFSTPKMFLSTIVLSVGLGFAIIYLVHRLAKWNEFRKQINLLPGPKALPIIGNAFELLGSQGINF